MKKVVHIQYSMESAGRAALRLYHTFNAANLQTSIVTLHNSQNALPGVVTMGKKARLVARLDDKIQEYLTRHTDKQMGSFSYPVLGSNLARLDAVKKADIIYIHWALKGFLNLRGFRQIVRLNKPVIFFMHDMWNITGGCHHSFTCDKYKTTGCDRCPMFTPPQTNDLAAREFTKKLRLYSKYNNLYFVAPSRWLYNCSKESLLTKNKPLFYIPNLFDQSLFRPTEKPAARKLLNIAEGETVIAFGAVTVNSPYKGWPYLQIALEILGRNKEGMPADISVLIFGSGYNKEIEAAIPFKTRFVGFLKDEYSVSLVYNAANVFVVPSLADNLPTTVLESLSCGTPVVGFDVGGIPDMISHRENGYLARYKSAEDLAEGIRFCIKNQVKGKVLANFEKDSVMKRHLDLMETIETGK